MILAAHHSTLRARKLAYLQADGLVWIDTGLPFTTTYTAKCKFQFVRNSSDFLSPFGFWYNDRYAGRMYWRGSSSDWRYQYPTKSAIIFASGSAMPFGDVHELEIGPSGVKMDGTTASISPVSFTNSSYKQHLFGSASYNPVEGGYKHEQQTSHSVIRIWSASWMDGNGNLVRDFVPQIVGGQAGMFDRVTQTFFGPASASTGMFSIGTEV